MALNVSLGFLSPIPAKPFVNVTESIKERSGFPPKPPNSVSERSGIFSPEKLLKQLVFTEFGLSPVSAMPSTELLLSTSKPRLPPRIPVSVVKLESSTAHLQSNIEANNGAMKDQKRCHCKKSKCLKLYCECFAARAYCDGCNCNCCRNNIENEPLRQEAAEIILERNPDAFRPKIDRSLLSYQDNGDDAKDSPKMGKHNRGCHCKKTECLKKYCECFQAKVLCSENCKCLDCKNYEGCVERVALSGKEYDHTKSCETSEGCEETMAVSCGYNGNINTCLYLEGSEEEMAISTVLGLSGPGFSQTYKKRKFQEFVDLNDKDTPLQELKNDQKENRRRFSNPLPIGDVSSAKLGSSKATCGSSLTDIIRSQDPKELCSVLVLVSEAAKILTDKNGTPDIQAVKANSTASIFEDRVQKQAPDDYLRGNRSDIKEGQDSSLRTIALMYNERDKLFIGTSNSTQILNHGCNADVYAGQERLVLASFLDYLRKLIALGNMKDQDAEDLTVNAAHQRR